MRKPTEVAEKFQSVVSLACDELVKCAWEAPYKSADDVKAILQFLAIVESLLKESREALDSCIQAQGILKGKIQQQKEEVWEEL